MKKLLIIASLGLAALSAGCREEEAATTSGGGSYPTPPATATAPSAGQSADGEHNAIPIGEHTAGGMKLVATMDAPVKPGGDGAFDVTITGAKPKAVRFWVGTQDAAGSVKAKAEEEKPGTWHTHAEVPDPLPAGSKFWAEVEPETGEKVVAGFELKR